MKVLDKFLKVTNYDISNFFLNYEDFVKNGFTQVVSYYKGSSVSKRVFSKLNDLVAESNKIQEIFSLNKEQLSADTSFWDLLEDFEVAKTKLETIYNWGRWSRSSYIYGYDSASKNSYILKQNQNLELVSELSGSNDSQNDWVKVSLDNQLMEIDYTKQGGNNLMLGSRMDGSKNAPNYGVVDYMVGDRVLGLDLPVKISFVDNDLKKLDVKESFEQAAKICLSTTKRSIPEYPTIGYRKIIGNGMSFILSNPINRELYSTFAIDKSFKSVELTDSKIEGDSILYEVKIVSILNDEFITTT